LSEPYAEIHWQSHDGLRLYARVCEGPAGISPTVLCLHGLTRNSRDFEDLAPHLQRSYRVIVPDLRGRGFSARDPNPQLEVANRGHVPLLDEPECIAALDAFLSRILGVLPA
jgi:alpha-beta hydrolase superfamily lysophospholipase